MNKSIKTLWVAKLRSGEVEQGEGFLGTDDGKRCCLGVLCDLAVEAGVIEAPTKEESLLNDEPEVLVYGYDDVSLPSEVRDWAGLSDSIGTIYSGEYVNQSLPDLNDGYINSFAKKRVQLNFEEIADVIEEVF